MRAASKSLPLLLGLVLLGLRPAQAGISIADPDELRGIIGRWITGADPDELVKVPGLRLSVRVIAVGWKGHARELPPRPLPHPLESADLRLVAPPGGWTDVVLVLEGPATLWTEDGAARTLWLEDLVIPLDDPDATGPMTLSLPALQGGEPALEARLQDGLLLVPVAR